MYVRHLQTSSWFKIVTVHVDVSCMQCVVEGNGDFRAVTVYSVVVNVVDCMSFSSNLPSCVE